MDQDNGSELARLAGDAYDAFERRTRADGSEFVTLKDDAPAWLRELVMEAHGDFMPDDWRYECIRAAFGFVHDGGFADVEDAFAHDGEFADGQVDAYNLTRAAWLGSSALRACYVDDAAEEFGRADSVMDEIGRGQYMEATEVYAAVVNGLGVQVDADDDEDGDQ